MTDPLQSALAAMRAHVDESTDPAEMVRAECLMTGYHLRWKGEMSKYAVRGVELEFTSPLRNPETGAGSRSRVRGGKIDAMATEIETKDDVVVEHKTSSEDISGGSVYWRMLRMNTQIADYMVGGRALGFDPKKTLYDVIGKIKIRPQLATPKPWKMTKPTKKDPVPRPYADVRQEDETLEEYRKRVCLEIAANPDKYFQRGLVVRTDEDEQDSAFDDWQTVQLMLEAERKQRYPRNADSCRAYNRVCEYFDACTRQASIDDDFLFETVSDPHAELTTKVSLPIVSNSEKSCFRKCARKHHYRYRLRRRSRASVSELRFGTLMHHGLEAWWQWWMSEARPLYPPEWDYTFKDGTVVGAVPGLPVRKKGTTVPRPATRCEHVIESDDDIDRFCGASLPCETHDRPPSADPNIGAVDLDTGRPFGEGRGDGRQSSEEEAEIQVQERAITSITATSRGPSRTNPRKLGF